jgi:hypothetical protein
MPKALFYAGTVFTLFLALTSAAESARQLQSGAVSFVAFRGTSISRGTAPVWTLVAAGMVAVTVGSILLRMASLLAARNLFAAIVALAAITSALTTALALMTLEFRMTLVHAPPLLRLLGEIHLVGYLLLGALFSLALMTLQPYFRIQASRVLAILVFVPLPLVLLVSFQEAFIGPSSGPLPAVSPASFIFFAVTAVLFFAVAVHCIRHRHLFIEVTNLRELLDPRVDPRLSPAGRRVRLNGDIAFDS